MRPHIAAAKLLARNASAIVADQTAPRIDRIRAKAQRKWADLVKGDQVGCGKCGVAETFSALVQPGIRVSEPRRWPIRWHTWTHAKASRWPSSTLFRWSAFMSGRSCYPVRHIPKRDGLGNWHRLCDWPSSGCCVSKDRRESGVCLRDGTWESRIQVVYH